MHHPTTTTIPVLARLRALSPCCGLDQATAMAVAERQASLLLRLSRSDSIPVSLDALRRVRGIELEVVSGLPSSGASYWIGDGWRLEASAEDHAHRQRFTFCHEFKHVIDHPVRDLLYPDGRTRERVADHFAACMLMPRDDLIRAWNSGERAPHQLATDFDVSLAAMTRRLLSIGLLDRGAAAALRSAGGLGSALPRERSFAIAGNTPIGDTP